MIAVDGVDRGCQTVRIGSPEIGTTVVWLEPWAERFEIDLKELPFESTAMAQQAFDGVDAPDEIRKIAALLLDELAGAFGESKLTAELLWSIGDQILRTKGIVLLEPGHETLATLVRQPEFASIVRLLHHHAVDCSPLRASARLRTEVQRAVKQPRVSN